MKANELRVGNWVSIRVGHPFRFELPDFADWYYDHNSHEYGDHIHPVPVTEEWLLRFGFEKRHHYWHKSRFFVEWLFDKPKLRIVINSAESAFANSVEYVHQLQNLYFALTGEELTIKQ